MEYEIMPYTEADVDAFLIHLILGQTNLYLSKK